MEGVGSDGGMNVEAGAGGGAGAWVRGDLRRNVKSGWTRNSTDWASRERGEGCVRPGD